MNFLFLLPGQGQFGEKTLVDQAKEYLHLASLNQVNFRTPRVCYVFYSGVTKPMAAALADLGVLVLGELMDISSDVQTKLSSLEDLDLDSNSDLDNCDDDLDEGMSHEFQKVLLGGDASSRMQVTAADERSDADVIARTVNQVPETAFDVGQGLVISERLEILGSESSSPGSQVTRTGMLHWVQASRSKLRESQDQEQPNNSQSEKAQTDPSIRQYYVFDGSLMSLILKNFFQKGISCFHESPSGRNSSKSSIIFDPSPVRKVNLDVTALIALISAVTHGHCYFIFEDDILSEQAAEERRCPVLPKMKEFLQGE